MSRSLHFHSKTRKRSHPEGQLQRAVVQFLTLAGTPDMAFLAIKNEGKRSQALGLEFKRQGLKPGASDLEIIVLGKMPLFLELKAKGGKQSPDQEVFQAYVERVGCRYEVADNINDAVRILTEYDAIRMTARRAA